jgi:hypothetical protein
MRYVEVCAEEGRGTPVMAGAQTVDGNLRSDLVYSLTTSYEACELIRGGGKKNTTYLPQP